MSTPDTDCSMAAPSDAECCSSSSVSPSTSFFPLKDLSADPLLAVLQHLNVLDLSSVALTSKRFLYLTHTVQTRLVGTECSALSEKAAALQVNKDARKKKTYRGGKRAGNYRPADVVRRALTRMRCPPSIAFMFHTSRGGQQGGESRVWYQESPAVAEGLLPPSCAILSAAAQDVQFNCNGLVESESGFGVLLASFDRSRTSFVPFCSEEEEEDDDDDEEQHTTTNTTTNTSAASSTDEVQQLIDRLDEAKPTAAPASYWKIIFVYACGNTSMDPDTVLGRIQAAYPDSSIVGGVCEGGHVRLFSGQKGRQREEGEGKVNANDIAAAKENLSRKTTRQLRTIITQLVEDEAGGEEEDINLPMDMAKEQLVDMAISKGFLSTFNVDPGSGKDLKQVLNGLFGVAIGGDVPVRTVVSRGARSLTTQEVAPTTSPWTVTDAAVVQPGELGHPYYRGDPDGGDVPFHVINRVKSSETGEELDGASFVLSNRAEFVGLRRTSNGTTSAGDGFNLSMLEMHNVATGRLMIAELGSIRSNNAQIADHVGSQIDLFKLDGPACILDVGLKLDRLKELVSGQRLLAGIMFSCNGRGPDAGYLLREEMCDAQRFNERFPSIPMLGFYAGGEIGPRAMAGNTNIFQTGQAALQGFTAVFALFIVPEVQVGSFFLDDGPESIEQYMRERRRSMCRT